MKRRWAQDTCCWKRIQNSWLRWITPQRYSISSSCERSPRSWRPITFMPKRRGSNKTMIWEFSSPMVDDEMGSYRRGWEWTQAIWKSGQNVCFGGDVEGALVSLSRITTISRPCHSILYTFRSLDNSLLVENVLDHCRTKLCAISLGPFNSINFNKLRFLMCWRAHF